MSATLTLDRRTHVYSFQGQEVPRTVTRVLRATIARDIFKGIPTATLERAAFRGSFVHEATALVAEDTLDWDAVRREQPDAESYLHAFELAVAREGLELIAPEVMVYHPYKQYAGTIDWLVRQEGTFGILDIKCGIAACVEVQLAAYVDALTALARFTPETWRAVHPGLDALEIPAAPLVRRIALMLKRNGSYRIERHPHYRADLALWDACLTVYHAQQTLRPTLDDDEENHADYS